jgi:HD superfamily phosphohydrolase
VLEGSALALVGTPKFQRLWGIRQTGFAHLVFPGANHTRLEHSLGAYWVAGRIAERLDLSPKEAETVRAAALLHDLGHGPFSHSLDGPMVEVLGHNHEAVSRALILGSDRRPSPIPAILRRHHVEPGAVADLVDPPRRRRGDRLLAEILHGAVDADRIDYLQRDAYYTGVAHGAIDAVRLLETLRAVDDRLVFAEKGRSAVEGFLVGRALMYSTVYFHKTVRSAEMMAQAAIERLRGFPDAARDSFSWTDGEWMTRVAEGSPTSAALVRGLAERRLYKRVSGKRSVGRPSHGAWRKYLRDPVARRRLEDELSGAARAPAGSVLIDLAGLEPRGDPGRDWAEIGLQVDGRTTFPFRQPSLWLLLATRPPAEWAVSVYVAPRYRARVERVLARDPSFLP